MPRVQRWITAGLIGLFFAVNLSWIHSDRLVRDGDEEGHVGAAELFLEDLRQGQFTTALHRGLVADMGDYPSLYPALVGGWWWAMGGGQPDRLPVRSFNLVFLFVAAGSVFAMQKRKRLPAHAAAIAAACILFLPLNVGIARHFMPEGALCATVALAIAAAVRQREAPGRKSALLLGLAVGAGLLTKQTFPLYVLFPFLLILRPHRSLAWALPGIAMAFPWIWTNLIEQHSYLESSATHAGEASLFEHIRYYPIALGTLGWGPVWTVLILGAAWVGWNSRHRSAVLLGAVWLLGGLLLLTLVPKKYPRLLVPLLPSAGLVLAAGIAARSRLSPLLLMGIAWSTVASISPKASTPFPRVLDAFDPGEPQVWFRAPERRGMGFESLRPFAEEHPGLPVLIQAGPQFSGLQTTHPWESHVGPWLRREGLDRQVTSDLGELEPGPYLLVDFNSPSPNAHLEALDLPFGVSLEVQ